MGQRPIQRLIKAQAGTLAVTLGGFTATVMFAQDSAARLMGWSTRLFSLNGGAPEVEMLEAVKDRVRGAYIMPPLGRYELALRVIEGIVR